MPLMTLITTLVMTMIEVKKAPSGVLYAASSSSGVNLATFNEAVQILKSLKLLTETHNQLYWVEPIPGSKAELLVKNLQARCAAVESAPNGWTSTT